MPVYRLLVEYDGACFHGWQVQPQVRTVQGELERALTILARTNVVIAAAGRTDRGVHARGQVASFAFDELIPTDRWMRGVNGICGPDLRVHLLEEAPEDFHARHRARWRLYRYRIALTRGPLARARSWSLPHAPGLPRLREACASVVGRHDFSAFANASPDAAEPVCEVQSAEWEASAEGYVFTIRGDRFLYKMVRTMVGTLVREASRGGGGEAVAAVLDSRDRRRAAAPAPAWGLTLEAVGYDPPWPDRPPFAG